MVITVDKQGAHSPTKASFPVPQGRYTEVVTRQFEFRFNLRGEIRSVRGLTAEWPHPSELLKRTDANDWAYYSVGTVGGGKIRTWLGEYYLPCLPYATNSLYEFDPFSNPAVMRGLAAWAQVYADLRQTPRDGLPPLTAEFLNLAAASEEDALHRRAQELHAILGGPLSVLPPDSRHVEYEVIPLVIADGCLYHCDFCCVKSPRGFRPRHREDILGQLGRLKTFFGRDLANYRGIFLGNHDALAAGDDLLAWAAEMAVEHLGMPEPALFLFGSVDSLLKAGDRLLERLNGLGGRVYLNVGFESMDPATLAAIHKPLSPSKLSDAFQKLLELNRSLAKLEVSANFLLGRDLSEAHYDSLRRLLSEAPPDPGGAKGAVYLSPLMNTRQRHELLDTFYAIQKDSVLPAYIYLIQRL